jgi:uncharacterized SAM-binding protein YcdF (DUF218 family)
VGLFISGATTVLAKASSSAPMSSINIIWYIIPLALLLAFAVAYRLSRTKLATGFFLSASLLSFMVIFFIQAYRAETSILRVLALIPVLVAILLLSFGVYIFIGFLILNTRSILKKETRSLKHCLTLIFAIFLIMTIALPRSLDLTVFPPFVTYLSYSVYGLVLYYFLHLTQFVISLVLCNLYRPRFDQDYIIVLGCRVKEGKVTALLASRVNRAIKFYHAQKKKGDPPKLILSGGQGADELCSEAEAMKEYALDKGLPAEDLLLEAKSRFTLENMEFSKAIMDETAQGAPYNCIYATSNFHLLRAGIIARRAGLKIDGIGAKTAFYFLPNAILREYISYLYMNLKWNVIFSALSLVLGSAAIYFISLYLS